MKKTKLLLLMLTLALAVTCCLSLTAFAEDGETPAITAYYNGAEVTYPGEKNGFDSLAEAFETCKETAQAYRFVLHKDLVEKTTTDAWNSTDGRTLLVPIYLTIASESGKNYTLTLITEGSDGKTYGGQFQISDKSLTLENVKLTNKLDEQTIASFCMVRFTASKGSVTLNGNSEISGNFKNSAIKYDGDMTISGPTLTLNDGKIVVSGETPLEIKAKLVMNAGVIEAESGYAGTEIIKALGGCANLELKKGYIRNAPAGVAAVNAENGRVSVQSEMVFHNNKGADIMAASGVEVDNAEMLKGENIISGKTLYSVKGKSMTYISGGKAYCYTDLETAMDAAASGSTIYFLDDVEFVGKTDGNVGNKKAKVYVMDKDAVKSIVLDAMKHKLTFGEWTDDEGSKLSSTIKVTHDSSVLTIKNATLIRTVGETPVVYLVPGQLNIQDSAVTLAGSYNGESALCWITNGEYARINIKNTKITECKSTSENDPNACLIRLDTGSVRLTECEVINNEMMLVRTNKKSVNYIAGYNAVIELNDTKINDNKIKTQNGGMICEQTWDGRQGDVSVYVNGNTVVKDNLTSTESVRNIDVSTGTNNGIIIGDNFTGSIGVYAGDRTSFGTASEVPSVESIKNDASATGQFARADGGKLVWTDKPTLKVETDLGKYETVTPATEEGGDETTTITHVLRVVTTNTNENTTPITKFGTYFVNTEDGTITTTNSYTGEKESADFGKGNGWVVDMVGDSSKSGNTGTVCAVSFYYVSGVTDPVTDVTTVEYDFTTAKTITEDQVITNDSDANAGGLGE